MPASLRSAARASAASSGARPWGFKDLIITLVFGLLSHGMVRLGWPRPPLVLGLVLGRLAETYLFISVTRYGLAWLGRPTVVALMVLTVVLLLHPILRDRRQVHTTSAVNGA